MNADQVGIVAATWQSVSADSRPLAREFYEELFNRSPSLSHLFAEDMSEQERRLTIALNAVVKNLASGRDVGADLRALGRRHAKYGVETKDYSVVGEAFLHALQQRLGVAFTGEVKSAWASAYELIAGEMKRGAEEL